jgi:mobilome CxxCx(11)CxxC protein
MAALSPQDRDRLFGARIDSIVAKNLHEQKVARLRRLSTAVEYLAFAVPILYFPARIFAAENSGHDQIFEKAWELLAAILAALALYKTIYRLSEQADKHSQARNNNILIASEILAFMSTDGSYIKKFVESLLGRVDQQDIADAELLGTPSEKAQQSAYRKALKEVRPDGSATCGTCHASPWRFAKGGCDVCGGTPADEVKNDVS